MMTTSSKTPGRARRTSIAIGVLCTLSLSSVTAGGPAMLTDLAGECELTDTEDDIYSCPLVQPLETGSVIDLGTDGRIVLVYLESAEEHRFSGKGRITVGADGPDSQGAEAEMRTLDNFGSTELSPLTDSKLIQATIVMRSAKSGVEPVWPVDNVNLLSNQPVFEWESKRKDSQYTLVVDREDGSRFAWIPAGPKTSIALSKPLEPGTSYVWRVEERGRKDSKLGKFSVPDETERARQRERLARLEARAPRDDAPFSERVLYAALLNVNGFDEAAREQWQALHRERPDVDTLSNLAR